MSRIIIFGCGGVGSKARRKLEAEGNEIICFTDNSRSKWGSSFEGKRVIAPRAILQENFDYIAIGMYKAVELIRRQLNEMGIDNNRIIVPIQPDRIFPNRINVSEEELRNLAMSEYWSKSTLAYKELNIQIEDEEFLKKLEDLKETLVENNIPRANVCVVSGAVLQAYGLRESKEFDDIDIIMTSELRDIYGKGLVIVSESAEMHPQNEYDVSDDDIILKEENHFAFQDLKFMNLEILYRKVLLNNAEEAKLIENFIKKNLYIVRINFLQIEEMNEDVSY